MKPLVFIAMPFGQKADQLRRYTIDFDDIYERAIKPAVARFNVDCIRADEERTGGVIHLAMFERLLLAEIAIVDVTLANPNVYYELGVRHAARPHATIIVGFNEGPLPFDIAMIRALPYKLTGGRLEDADCATFVEALCARLEHTLAEHDIKDSPLFQLIPGLRGQALPHEVTDTFRDRARERGAIRGRLDAAKRKGRGERDTALAMVTAIEQGLGDSSSVDGEIFLEVFLTYRDLQAYDEMIALAERAPEHLRATVPMLSEQHAFALNRRNHDADRTRAVALLEGLIEKHGHSPETSSLLARIFKDQYFEALSAGERLRAGGCLTRAIELYRHGFNADPRDYYPGVNLVTLLALKGNTEAQAELNRTVPAVAFAVGRLGGVHSTDYWQVATVLELAVLGSDQDTATRALEIIATLDVQEWCYATTAKNLKLLANTADGVLDKALLSDALAELERMAARPPASE